MGISKLGIDLSYTGRFSHGICGGKGLTGVRFPYRLSPATGIHWKAYKKSYNK
jgi:hypothetical protein